MASRDRAVPRYFRINDTRHVSGFRPTVSFHIFASILTLSFCPSSSLFPSFSLRLFFFLIHYQTRVSLSLPLTGRHARTTPKNELFNHRNATAIMRSRGSRSIRDCDRSQSFSPSIGPRKNAGEFLQVKWAWKRAESLRLLPCGKMTNGGGQCPPGSKN